MPPCPEWDLSDSEDEAVPLAQELLAKGLVPPSAVTVDTLEDPEIEEASDAESASWE